jgi:soluble lytic murein transglycosylase-like protein
MQLMPGTAARFGVRNSFDPAQNIHGGTQYLKELLKMFGGRVDLALASYNAGEGAVIKYGGKVPPYRETRDYVRRISGRYGIDRKRSQESRSLSPE